MAVPNITLDQAKRCVQTGIFYIDLQRNRLDSETTTVCCDSATSTYKLLGQAEAGNAYRMWATIWPPNADPVTAPWYTSVTEIKAVDLNLIAETFVATWGSNTSRGIYR